MQPKAWQFVTVEQSSKRKIDQRVVRRAAMKDFRRSERLARTEAYKATQAKQKQQDTLSDQNSHEWDWATSAPSTIGRSIGKGIRCIDPFGSTALPDRQDAPVLLLHRT